MRSTSRTRTAATALAMAAGIALAGCSADGAVEEQDVDLGDVALEGDDSPRDLGDGAVSALEGDQQPLSELDLEPGGDEVVDLEGETVTVRGLVSEVYSDSAIRLTDGEFSAVAIDLDGPLADSGLEATPELVEDEVVVVVTGTLQRYEPEELGEIADAFGPGYEDGDLDRFARDNLIVVEDIARYE